MRENGFPLRYVLLHQGLNVAKLIHLQVVEYITLQLINAHKNATNATDSILNQYDFHIFPVVNPDGKLVMVGALSNGIC